MTTKELHQKKSKQLALEQLERADLYTWMVNNYYLPSGEKYSFIGHEYLVDIVKRTWKLGDNVFVRKSSQCGMSEVAIALQLWMNERGLKNWKGGAYFFPARQQLDDHVKSRVMPILEIPRFSKNLKQANLRILNYCNRPIYFRSGQTRREIIAFAGDYITLDEFDEFENPMSIIPSIRARFNHSEYKWIMGLSTPTYQDIGIDAAFKNSNQYYYYVPCEKCKAPFSPLMEVEVNGFQNCIVEAPITKEVGFVCPKCRELTNTCGIIGKWELEVKKDNQNYGYSVSRLFTPRTTLKELLNLYEEALNVQEFYNSNIGLPYSPPNSRLSYGDIVNRCIGVDQILDHSTEPTWCGIDVGKKCHYVIGRSVEDDIEVISYGAIDFDDIDSMLYKFNVKYLVIDLRPYEQNVKKVIKGKANFWASDYNAGKQESWYTLVKADGDVSGGGIKVIKNDRTQTCDVVIDKIVRKKSIIFPIQTKGDQKFIKQLTCMQKMEKADRETGEIKMYYNNTGKNDHYFHALGYLILAFQLKRRSGIAQPGIQLW